MDRFPRVRILSESRDPAEKQGDMPGDVRSANRKTPGIRGIAAPVEPLWKGFVAGVNRETYRAAGSAIDVVIP